VLRQNKLPISTIKDFALEFADLQKPDEVYSSHALDALADIYSEEKDKQEDAKKALDLLANKYDPIRAHYWNYRKGLLEQAGAAAA
jgi:protein farnesyltransferase/geranylgeranyltransferase type-1 subunit alpha